MSVEQESGLSRWSKLKQARKARQQESKKRKRGKAAPLVEGQTPEVLVAEKPFDPIAATGAATIPEGQIAGPFKPWMPPLNAALPAEAEIPPDGKNAKSDEVPDDQPKEADYDLPPIESLTPESDFTPFMKDGIPELLKKRAMRKLWMSNPVLANLDGLNEYDEDYSMIGKVVEEVVTRYKVGKGAAYEDEDVEDLDDLDEIEDADGELEVASTETDHEAASSTDESNGAPSNASSGELSVTPVQPDETKVE